MDDRPYELHPPVEESAGLPLCVQASGLARLTFSFLPSKKLAFGLTGSLVNSEKLLLTDQFLPKVP